MDQNIDRKEERRPPGEAAKIIRQNAISLTAVFIILLVATFLLREQLQEASQYFWIGYMLIMLVVIIFTQLQIREKVNGGIITFSGAFSAGMKFSLWVAAIYACFNLIFYWLIFPNAADEMIRLAEQGMREKNMPEDQIEMGLKVTRWFVSPLGIFIMNLVVYPIMGAIDSLIAAAFTQRVKN